MKVLSALGKWALNVLIGIDQLGNAVLMGDPDETISSRLGKIARENGGQIQRWRLISRLANWALEKIDNNHCAEAIELDEGVEAILE